MIIDANAFLGRWGLRTKGCAAPETFLSLMDKAGINVSMVTSTVALVTDTVVGNKQLVSFIKPYPERLIGVAVVNPKWGLNEALSYLKDGIFKAVRLSPSIHEYSLMEKELIEPLAEILIEKDISVYVTANICHEFSHPVYSFEEICEFAGNHPKLNIIVSGLVFHMTASQLPIVLGKNKNLYIEISNLWGGCYIEKLVEAVSDRILLGTASAINYPFGMIEVIKKANIKGEDKEKVLGKNAAKLFKLKIKDENKKIQG